MRWPWQPKTSADRLVMACSDEGFVYVQARGQRILRCGIERGNDKDSAALARGVRALDLPERGVVAVLALAEAQLLQIEAPAVQAEELKAAARWRIKDLVETHLDDLTLDVMHVGDSRPKAQRQLFVVAASSKRVRELSEWSQAARLQLAVIDIRETAQRNLQNAWAAAHTAPRRATAALMLHGTQCLLTICAEGELFYARRLEWQAQWLNAAGPSAAFDRPDRPLSGFADLDIVDYSDDAYAEPGAAADVPPLVLELQRSFDVWERSWTDLPLERLVVYANGHTAALVALLETVLPVPVEALDVEALFPGFDAAAGSPELAAATVPLLGALLRSDVRQA